MPSLVAADYVADRILTDTHSGGYHPVGYLFVHFAHGRRRKAPCQALRLLTMSGQEITPRSNILGRCFNVSHSAPPVCTVGPGRRNQRYMVMSHGVSNAETYWHIIQKGQPGVVYAMGSKIFSDRKDKLVPSFPEFRAVQEWPISPPLRIGKHRLEKCPCILRCLDAPELDRHAVRRTTTRNVEYVRCQKSGHL